MASGPAGADDSIFDGRLKCDGSSLFCMYKFQCDFLGACSRSDRVFLDEELDQVTDVRDAPFVGVCDLPGIFLRVAF